MAVSRSPKDWLKNPNAPAVKREWATADASPRTRACVHGAACREHGGQVNEPSRRSMEQWPSGFSFASRCAAGATRMNPGRFELSACHCG